MKRMQSQINSLSSEQAGHGVYNSVALFAVTEVSKVCNENRDRCYWMKLGSYDYQKARDVCLQDGGDLAVIDSKIVYNLVTNSKIM